MSISKPVQPEMPTDSRKCCPSSSRRLGLWQGAAILVGSWLAPRAAWAVLGEGLAGIEADTAQLAGVRRRASGAGFEVHTLTGADGSTIRQYVGVDGRVFAVAWNTHYKPRLDLLLGQHFSAYEAAGRHAMGVRPGIIHSAALQEGDLVVESTAHLQSFVGRAYLRSMLPAGSRPDAFR
jgi:hypothetical protein